VNPSLNWIIATFEKKVNDRRGVGAEYLNLFERIPGLHRDGVFDIMILILNVI